jgi:murein DD-endopeptidase MepM/ murein hydrolase activator NlpD
MRVDLRSVGGLLASGAIAGASLTVSALVWQACASRQRRAPELARGTGAAAPLPADLIGRALTIPVQGVSRETLADSFLDPRGSRTHEAIDIMAPRHTPVLAVADGSVARLTNTRSGGISVYQLDAGGRYCYFYAHLEGHAPGLREGQPLRRGDPIGRVGTSGNAPANAPHLHFAISRLDGPAGCPGGTPVNPYTLLALGEQASPSPSPPVPAQ